MKYLIQNKELMKISFYIILLVVPCLASSQQQVPGLLTMEDALRLGIEYNYNIRLSKQEEEIADLINNKGTAGYLPQVTLGITQNNTLNNADLDFANGGELSVRGAFATGINGNLSLNWRFFDGMRRHAIKRRLENDYQVTRLNTRAEVEFLMADIIKAYYGIVQQRKLINFTEQNLEISRSRLDLAIQKERIGTGSGSSVLQSRLDYNNDSLNYVTQKLQLDVLRYQLLETMQINSDVPFEVETDVKDLITKNYNELRADIISQNLQLLMARYMIRNAEESVLEAKGFQYPDLFLNAGGTFGYSRNPANFVVQNINYGPFLGVTAAYNLYDGGNIKRNIQVAKVQAETQKIQQESLLNTSVIQLNNLITQHAAYDQLVNIHEQNIIISNQNLEIAVEQYRLGAITDVEFREIQLKSIQSNFELVQTQLLKKFLEADILRITGNLVVD
jgi:outer membrane protein